MASKFREVAGVTGMVSEVQKYKAFVSFGLEGSHEQAILKIERFSGGGKRVRTESLTDVLSVGSVVKFWAHIFHKANVDNCGWFITHAFLRDINGELGRGPTIDDCAEYLQGLYHHTGRIYELDGRVGVIKSTDTTGATHTVFFTASKFFFSGKHFDSKEMLQEVVKENDLVHFDAIPANPDNNAKACEWFATLVWIGKRPLLSTMPISHMKVNFKEIISGSSFNKFLYRLCNAKALFVKGKGQIMFLINHEFGVALISLKTNMMQTALFHRNDTLLYGQNMRNCDLRKFFTDGDRINFIGVEAPDGLLTKFVAAEISIYRH